MENGKNQTRRKAVVWGTIALLLVGLAVAGTLVFPALAARYGFSEVLILKTRPTPPNPVEVTEAYAWFERAGGEATMNCLLKELRGDNLERRRVAFHVAGNVMKLGPVTEIEVGTERLQAFQESLRKHLLEALQTDDPALRNAALYALNVGSLPRDQTIEELVEELAASDPVPAVRETATEVLRTWKRQEAQTR